MKDDNTFSDNGPLSPPLLLMNGVRIVTGARSHHLLVYLKMRHHRLINLRWNGGSPRVTTCGGSWCAGVGLH